MRTFILCVALATILGCVYGATTAKRPGQPVIQTQQSSGNKGRPVQHPAFVNAGKTPGVEIWRIQSFNPVAVPKGEFGKFYTGDSYIVLVTKQNKNNEKSWDLFFWIGRETTADESGSAAALTVQLDDQLGGAPVQYREVQEHESQLFKSNFKNGLQYLSGGNPSGFRHVDNTVQKKLYQVKGKKNIRVKQVEFSVASMNKGDCFILDAGNDIYVYVGKDTKRVEKLKAVSAANLIRDIDHGGRSKIHVVDEFSTEDEFVALFQALGSGSQNQVPEANVGGDDEQFERNEENNVFLYKVSDASGKVKVDKVTQKPMKQEQLDTNDCFILDTENADVYVWVGKKCNSQEKTKAMSEAQNFVSNKKYPSWVKVQRIVENAEPSVFRQYFQTWKGYGDLHSRLI